jgi:ABC-type uncharacterized transport system substrate-binding protein
LTKPDLASKNCEPTLRHKYEKPTVKKGGKRCKKNAVRQNTMSRKKTKGGFEMKKNGLKTLTGILCMVFALFLVLPLSGECAEKVLKIGIAQFITHPALDATRKGFIDQMVKEGFVDGKNIKYYQSNAEADMSLAQSIARKFVSQRVDMIQSITTPMSQACVAAARGTDIPIVFSAVTDPVKGQLVDSWDKPGGNVTGVSDWMDVEAQIALILEVLPKVRKLGVLFNPGEINAQVQVDEMKKAAKKLGLEKVVEASVPTTSDAFAAAKSIVGRVDARSLPWQPFQKSARSTTFRSSVPMSVRFLKGKSRPKASTCMILA